MRQKIAYPPNRKMKIIVNLYYFPDARENLLPGRNNQKDYRDGDECLLKLCFFSMA